MTNDVSDKKHTKSSIN